MLRQQPMAESNECVQYVGQSLPV